MKEFGPTPFQRLAQSQAARDQMVDHARAKLAHDEIESSSSSSSRRSLGLLRRAYATGATFFATSLAACTGVGAPVEGRKAPSEPGETGFELPFRDSDPWYLTGGPHSDGLSGGVRYAIDFAPPEVVPCPAGKPLEHRVATASASGEVVTVGNERDRTDKNHSIVEIKLADGTLIGYMHLSNIKIEKGQKVKAGDPIGNPSCELPPGGSTRGVHLHSFMKDKNGRPMPIAGTVFSGYKVGEGKDNYQGNMTKEGEATRTADERRCGPDQASINACGGERNDLSTQPGVIMAAPRSPVQESERITLATVAPTVQPRVEQRVPTPVERPPEPGWIKHVSIALPYSIHYPQHWGAEAMTNQNNIQNLFAGIKDTDAFYNNKSPDPRNYPNIITASVSVTRTQIQTLANLDAHVRQRITEVQRLRAERVEFQKIAPVDGERAFELNYSYRWLLPGDVTGRLRKFLATSEPFEVADVLVQRKGAVWHILFASTLSAAAEEGLIFREMLSSLKFLD